MQGTNPDVNSAKSNITSGQKVEREIPPGTAERRFEDEGVNPNAVGSGEKEIPKQDIVDPKEEPKPPFKVQ